MTRIAFAVLFGIVWTLALVYGAEFIMLPQWARITIALGIYISLTLLLEPWR